MLSRNLAYGLIVVSGVVTLFLLGVAALVAMDDPAVNQSGRTGTGVAVVVHPRNALDCLTVEQLHRLWWAGSTIDKWNHLDARFAEAPIALHAPPPGTAAHEAFTASVVGEEGALRTDATIGRDEDQVIDRVATDEHAIGFVRYTAFIEVRRPLKAIAVDAGGRCVEPTQATIEDGSYALLSE